MVGMTGNVWNIKQEYGCSAGKTVTNTYSKKVLLCCDLNEWSAHLGGKERT